MKSKFLVLGVGIFVAFGVRASELDDCLISGLKGVSSDTAALMIRRACENKVASQKKALLLEKHGEPSGVPMGYMSHQAIPPGGRATFRNPTEETAILVELSLSNRNGSGSCMPYPEKKYLYRSKTKPGSAVTFIIPDLQSFLAKDGSICIDATIVRTKRPSLTDLNFGASDPMTQAEIDTLNAQLGTDYAGVRTPAPAAYGSPGSSGGIFDQRVIDRIMKDSDKGTRR